jgi:arsenite methyltransferase
MMLTASCRQTMANLPSKPDYGIDAPGVIWTLTLIGLALILVSEFAHSFTIGSVTFVFGGATLIWGAALCLEAVAMIVYSKSGKMRHRDRMLAMVNWTGAEQVLDVGTGRGLLMIGAAKKLTTGKAVGIDIWSAKDLSGNSLEATLRNAAIEGVSDRVQVESGDATAMKFPDASFDVVLSNLCIHNIPTREGRDRACREIVRVLKPGGKALISDFIHTGQYATVFESAGATTRRTGWNFAFVWPPLRIVEVEKPGLIA